MPPIIYISSTFRDLHTYRAKMRAQLDYLVAYGSFTLSRIMETMIAGGDLPALDECLHDVNSCNIYLLVIGKIYGSIAPGTNLSYTENEFQAAVLGHKTIIPLYAATDAEGLAGFPMDDEAKFDKFKKTVQDGRIRFPSEFTNPDTLVIQMLTALYPFAGRKWEVLPTVKYCCNRSIPYRSFRFFKRQGQLNVASIVCIGDDKPDYFVQRLAKYLYGLDKEYLKEPLRVNNFIGVSPRYSAHRMQLMIHLVETFDLNTDSMPNTLEGCCQLLVDKHINNIFVRLYLTANEANDPRLKTTLETYFKELSAICKAKNLTIFYVVIFQFANRASVNDELLEWITANLNIQQDPISTIELDGFTEIHQAEVDDWVNNYLLDTDTAANEIVQRVKAHVISKFPTSENARSMEETFYILNDLIDLAKEN